MGSKLSPQPQQSNPMVSKIFIFSSTTNFKIRVFHIVWKINNFLAPQVLSKIHFDNLRGCIVFAILNSVKIILREIGLSEKLLNFHTVFSTALRLGFTTFDSYNFKFIVVQVAILEFFLTFLVQCFKTSRANHPIFVTAFFWIGWTKLQAKVI